MINEKEMSDLKNTLLPVPESILSNENRESGTLCKIYESEPINFCNRPNLTIPTSKTVSPPIKFTTSEHITQANIKGPISYELLEYINLLNPDY